MKKTMRQAIEKAVKDVKFDFSRHILLASVRDIVDLFKELEYRGIIDFSIYNRSDDNEDYWYQVEWYSKKIGYVIILDYDFDSRVNNVDDIVKIIDHYNQLIEKLKTKLN